MNALRAKRRWIAALEEKVPINGPVRGEFPEADQAFTGGAEDRQAIDRLVEPIDGANHRMPETIGGDGKLHGHERFFLWFVEFQGRTARVVNSSVLGSAENIAQGVQTDDRGKEIMEDHPLVVPAYLTLNALEVRRAEHNNHAIVEAQHGCLQLADDHVFIVARIAKKGAGWLGGVRCVSRYAARLGIIRVSRQRIAQQHGQSVSAI